MKTSVRGRILANPTAGRRSVSIEDLSSLFPGDEVVATQPDQTAALIEETIREQDSRGFVGIAGGDGTVRSAAQTMIRGAAKVPLLVVPAGTRNHFATDLGLGTPDAAATAATGGEIRAVDVGCVNDEMFVNNSSVGSYPHMVLERDGHERRRRLPKRLATVVAAWHQFRDGRRIVVDIDGVSRRVWAVFVGNNCYGEAVRDLTGRERLDEGVLDLRIARADRRLSRLRIAGAVLFGRLARSPLIERRAVTSVIIAVGGRVSVALDGEVVTMSSPLRYRSCPQALRVLVPVSPGSLD